MKITRRRALKGAAGAAAASAVALPSLAQPHHPDAKVLELWREWQRLQREDRRLLDAMSAVTEANPVLDEDWGVQYATYREEPGGEETPLFAYTEEQLRRFGGPFLGSQRQRKQWVDNKIAELNRRREQHRALEESTGFARLTREQEANTDRMFSVEDQVRRTKAKGLVGVGVKLAVVNAVLSWEYQGGQPTEWYERTLAELQVEVETLAGAS